MNHRLLFVAVPFLLTFMGLLVWLRPGRKQYSVGSTTAREWLTCLVTTEVGQIPA